MNLNLTLQSSLRSQFAPVLLQLKEQMDMRSEIWNKLSLAQKKKYIKSGKDKVLDLYLQIIKHAIDNFPELVDVLMGRC